MWSSIGPENPERMSKKAVQSTPVNSSIGTPTMRRRILIIILSLGCAYGCIWTFCIPISIVVNTRAAVDEVIRTIMIGSVGSSTKPTELMLANSAAHVVTSIRLLYRTLTLWTLMYVVGDYGLLVSII
jgi:hypothetical protein